MKRAAERGERNPRGGILLILAAAAALYAVFIARTAFRVAGILHFTLVDDAMISMRYAQHLARGFGLAWNIGQPPVEGFTNPAWMLVMAALHLLPIPTEKISLAIMIAAAVCLLGGIAVVYRICQGLHPTLRITPVLAAGLTAFYFPLVFWSLRGMEVGLLTLLIDAAVLLTVAGTAGHGRHDAFLLGIVLSLAVLTRLDALVQVLILLGYMAVARADRHMIAVPLVMVLVTVAGILIFQRLYFGDFLPNTYYQKMAGTTPAERIPRGLLDIYLHGAWDTLLPAGVAIAGLALYRNLRRPSTILLGTLFLVQVAYSIWVGGDYAGEEVNAANRFITQGMPPLIVLFTVVLDRLLADARSRLAARPRARTATAAALSLVALAVMSGGPWLAWLKDNAPMLPSDVRRTRLGVLLAKYTAPQAVIAVHAAGSIPYYSERTAVDLLGLNDPLIAKGPLTGPFYPGHDKWNYVYSIGELQPDVIADNWIKLPAFMKERTDYVHLDNGMYVRSDSRLVDIPGLLRADK